VGTNFRRNFAEIQLKFPSRLYLEWIHPLLLLCFTFMVTLNADKIIRLNAWQIFLPLFLELALVTYILVMELIFPKFPAYHPIEIARFNSISRPSNTRVPWKPYQAGDSL
jgi:hypothetical protein